MTDSTTPIVCLPSLGEPCGACHRCQPPVTVDDLADVPIWRYHPSPDECDHPVTVTRRLDIVNPAGDVVGHTTDAVTACLVCHHLAPAQEDQ